MTTTTISGHVAQPSAVLREWRTHWRLGLLALVGSAVSYAVWVNISSLFVAPLQREFGWTRGQIATAQAVGIACTLFAPLLGRLIDRVGVRRVLLCCVVLSAASFIALSQLQASLPMYYALLGAACFFGLGTTGLSYARIVCGAFVQSRGLALAVMRMGLAIGGALIPLAVQAAMTANGWRAGFVTFGTLMLVVAVPLVWLWAPRDDARRPTAAAAADDAGRTTWRSPKVLLLGVGVMLAYVPLFATFSQMQPLLVSKGLEAAGAGRMLGLIGVAALVGAIVAGVLLDRLWAPLVGLAFTLLPCAGFAILLAPGLTPTSAACAVVLLGVGYGAENDLLGYMVARYFGMARYSALYGQCQLFIALGAGAGVSSIGLTYDRFGSYEPALWVAFGLSALAAVCYLGMGRYPRRTDG